MSSAPSESSSQIDAITAVQSPPDGITAAQRVDECLVELAKLAQTEQSSSAFYAALLDRTLAILPAVGAAVWQTSPSGETRLVAQLRFPAPLLSRQEPALANGQDGSSQSYILPPFARASSLVKCDHPFPWPLLVSPFAIDETSSFVLEIALPEESAQHQHMGATRLAGVIAEVAADFQRRKELVRLRERERGAARFVALIGRLHTHLDPVATAYTIVNDGRQWIGCDRVSVLRLRRDRAVTLAVSAVDRFDRRSGQIALLERLGAAVGRSGEPLVWQEASSGELPAELAEPLHAYLDASHARQMVVAPMRSAPPPGSREGPQLLGLLVSESFSAERSFDAVADRTSELAILAAPALANSFAHHDLPLLGLQTRLHHLLSAVKSRPLAITLALAALVAVAVCLAVVPADFDVEVQGTLQPLHRKNLFAPSDGVVEEVVVQHGHRVTRGEVLLRIRSPALELDESRLAGELQTAQARAAAVRSLLSAADESAENGSQDKLASEELQLAEQIKSLATQLAIVQKWRDDLAVVSPLDGNVLTWNAEQLLSGRPVKAGQVLLTVAGAASPWVLELELPDRQAGHVLAGQRKLGGRLPVTFLLASDPAITYRGQLQSIALASDASGGQSAAAATVAVAGPLPEQVRAGTRVTARIECGRRSVGYVWLHDVIDFVRTSLFF